MKVARREHAFLFFFLFSLIEIKCGSDTIKKERSIRWLLYLNYLTTQQGIFKQLTLMLTKSKFNILVNPDLSRRQMHIFPIQNYAAPATKILA